MTAQLALLVYIFMFAAVIRLRYTQPNRPRPFRLASNRVVIAVAGMGIVTCCVAIAIGFIPPHQMPVGNIWWYESFLVSGMLIFALIPYCLCKYRLSA